MDEQGITVADHFELAIQGEYAALELYNGLIRKFAGYPDVVALWRIFAAEEVEHARALEKIFAALPPEQLAAPADPDMFHAAQEAQRVSVPDLLAQVHNLEDAYQLVTELENSETNAVFEFLITHFESNEEVSTFVLAQLREHIARLQTVPEKLGGHYQRLQIKTQTD